VSEFQHKLLDWLEDAFRLISLSAPSARFELSDLHAFYTTFRVVLYCLPDFTEIRPVVFLNLVM